MSRKKSSRYAEKLALGLVPHRYDRDSRGFREGVRDRRPLPKPQPRTCLARPGRHCFVRP